MKKNLFGIGTGLLIGLMTLGCVCNVYAAGITAEDAERIALEAANVTKEEIVIKEERASVDDGRNIFEVDFFIPEKMKYEFDIDAETGAIVDQDMEAWDADDSIEYAELIREKEGRKEAAAGEISEEEAKDIALKDAGLTADAVTFTKCHKEMDDGVVKYEIEFRTSDGMEYGYDLRASDGMILEKDIDRD